MSLIAALADLPASVWVAVIAPLSALAGVMLANKSNDRRTALQLRHEATENQAKRSSETRRQVYLDAVEALAGAFGALGNLPHSDPAEPAFSAPAQTLAKSGAKLQVVASHQTAILASEFGARYMEAWMSLIASAAPMHEVKADIKLHDAYYSRAVAEVDRLLAAMKSHNESGAPDPVKFEALQRAFKYSQAEVNNYAEARARAWTLFNRLNAQYVRELLPRLRSLQDLQISLSVALRADLGFETSQDAYAAQLRKSADAIAAALEGMLMSLEARLPAE